MVTCDQCGACYVSAPPGVESVFADVEGAYFLEIFFFFFSVHTYIFHGNFGNACIRLSRMSQNGKKKKHVVQETENDTEVCEILSKKTTLFF